MGESTSRLLLEKFLPFCGRILIYLNGYGETEIEFPCISFDGERVPIVKL